MLTPVQESFLVACAYLGWGMSHLRDVSDQLTAHFMQAPDTAYIKALESW